mmetsp:Transcript_24566/g.51906  ORF Transcript_24566/g.51906 Transcript_24566/m.51906 type:complete len:1230 (+) Transcript_24566:184-3873(+)
MTLVEPPPRPTEENEDSRDMAIKEARLEQLLSEKLMQGYVLMETSCPKCLTPLVKNHQMVPRTLYCRSNDYNDTKTIDKCVLLPQKSFEQPFKPVNGVPICVSCNSHVITQESEISILEQCASMKNKGSIYVALENATADTSTGSITTPASHRGNTTTAKSNQQQPEEPEIIHLEDFNEAEITTNNHLSDNDYDNRQQEPIVVVDVETLGDGNSNFELTLTPREGAETKPINLVEKDDEDSIESYTEKREIATKVLGAKMLQGFTLQEKTCDKCAMPVMSYKGKVDCVVCPALAKKARKKLRQKQKLEEEDKARQLARVAELEQVPPSPPSEDKAEQEQETIVVQKVDSIELEPTDSTLERNFQEEIRIQREKLANIQSVRSGIEEKALREEKEETRRAEERQKAIEAEKVRILDLQKQEEERVQDLIKEEAQLVREAQERACLLIEQEKEELSRLEAIAQEERQKRQLAEEHRKKEQEVAALEAQKKAIQKAETKALAEELERIEGLDEETLLNDKALAMRKDLMVEEYRQRMAKKAALDEEIAKLEEERLNEEIEARKLADQHRAESESRMIASLEADAAMKALAAEDAIRRAKDALAEVKSTKKQIISQTIQLAEKEVVAETEQTIKADHEDNVEHVLLPTNSEIEKERWETLRMEGRAIMTRRILQGWQLLPEACKGAECFMSPLVGRPGRKECTVCGGTGSGTDGAYSTRQEDEAGVEPALSLKPSIVEKTKSCDDDRNEDLLICGPDEEFEKKRAIYSKEIGKRMLLGWILVDAACPKCIMPLMMDDLGNNDICVVCGEVNKNFDASTIATKDMAFLEVADEDDDVAKEVVEDVDVAVAVTPKEVAKSRPVEIVQEDTAETVQEKTAGTVQEDTAESVQEDTAATVQDTAETVQEDTIETIEEPIRELVILRSDSDLCSTIQKQAMKQQKKRHPVTTSDPPAFKTEPHFAVERMDETAPQSVTEKNVKDVIRIDTNDFADSAAIQKTVGDGGRDDAQPVDISIDMVANLFLKSPHGYDFQDFGKSMNVVEVKELVDIFLVTNVDRDVSSDFKFSVAQRILAKMNFMTDKDQDEVQPLRIDGSHTREQQFEYDEVEDDNTATKSTGKLDKRARPRPEDQVRRLPPISPGRRSTPRGGGMSRKNTVIVGGPMARESRRLRDDMSVASRASTVASDALESIYDRIDACKKKLLDPKNTLDEQIATASLLERLAQAAVAVKEMEYVE